MYDVFNMGIGMVLFVRPGDAPAAFRLLEQAGEEYRVIGRVEKQRSGRSVVLPGFGE